ncbi:MAG TPA: phage tail protein [Croceibacterium sp.]|nr:phage tail protein [Croceibacterium sp.]
MATLVLTAVGTAIGGPIGGAIGSLIGNRIDRAVIGSGHREGARLKELAVTTSSYGAPIPRHFGTVRAPGTIIWATDLAESSERTGGGKGRPSTTTYSYSVSFAVALASRPIRRLGRIWADGNLLRGAAGDLKTGGVLRVHAGHGDQMPDPLIASAEGAGAPAFRGTAYCVFEALQLADFGNRIPALTFEIVAGDGSEVTLVEVMEPLGHGINTQAALPGLTGYSDEGGSLAETLAGLNQLYPLACDAGGEKLTLSARNTMPANPVLLPEAAIDGSEGAFGGAGGIVRRRQAEAGQAAGELRYYDPARDYQPGLQRVDGQARPGLSRAMEFPGVLSAQTARTLVNAAAERAGSARESLSWRVAELDPMLRPGGVVRVPGHTGLWHIDTWEWGAHGIELELSRLPGGGTWEAPTDPGRSLPTPDLIAMPTLIAAFELPWEGAGNGDLRQVYAAVSSVSAGWTGAALYADLRGELTPLGGSGTRRSVIGALAGPLGPSTAMLLETDASAEVDLASPDFMLTGASAEAIAAGANRALVGGEVLQFAGALSLGEGRWRLRGLLRGRGGTETAAKTGHMAGARFVLRDGGPVRIDTSELGASDAVAAIGLADAEPVVSSVVNAGITLRPLTPVHPRMETNATGVTFRWTRRSRGGWNWADGVEVPLNEQAESWLVGVGPVDASRASWQSDEPSLTFTTAEWASALAAHGGQPLWVRQAGNHALSDALLLTTLP